MNFSEAVTGLQLSDFTTNGIDVANLQGSGNAYTVDLTFTGSDGVKEIFLAANAVSDTAGNGNAASLKVSTMHDTSVPIATLDSLPSLTNQLVIEGFGIEFSEEVTGLELGDFSTNGLTVANLQGTGSSYTLDLLFNETQGIKELALDADAVSDMAGNTNVASAVITTKLDTLAPVVTLDSMPSNTKEQTVSNVSVNFSENVIGLELSDFNVSGLVVSNLQGSGSTYTIDLTLEAPDGYKELHLAAGAVTDAAGNANIVSETLVTLLDTLAPETAASATQHTQNTTTIQGSYLAVENGSGLAKVELYAKEPSKSNYERVGEITDGVFTYIPSKTGANANGVYAFYTIGTDNLGNVESAPAQADVEVNIFISNGSFWLLN